MCVVQDVDSLIRTILRLTRRRWGISTSRRNAGAGRCDQQAGLTLERVGHDGMSRATRRDAQAEDLPLRGARTVWGPEIFAMPSPSLHTLRPARGLSSSIRSREIGVPRDEGRPCEGLGCGNSPERPAPTDTQTDPTLKPLISRCSGSGCVTRTAETCMRTRQHVTMSAPQHVAPSPSPRSAVSPNVSRETSTPSG